MPRITPAALRQQIASGEAGPLYVLEGKDEAEKADVAAQFADLVPEDLRAFNMERLYGGETTVAELEQAAATLPMMAPRRVVVVLDGEKLLMPKRESKAADEEQERLIQFVTAPPGHATVVFVCGALDRRRKVVTKLLDHATSVDCGTIENAADAERWVKARAARDRIPLDAGAIRTLVERAGSDILWLRAGLERLAIYGMGAPVITADDVRQAVPAVADAGEHFGIANAIRRGDASTALRELHLALDAGTAPVMVLGQLRVAAEQLPPVRLRGGAEAVFRADTAIKSTVTDPRMLLERLVVDLCGGRAG